MQAEEILDKLGITRIYYGYYILADIISGAVSDEDLLFSICAMYAAEAIKYNKTESAVEKAARTAVSKAWRTAKAEIIKMAGYNISACPSVSEFCAIIVGYLLRQKTRPAFHSNRD